ncbi:MAG TPA: zinc ribbon domain-containing protein [Acidimicrobiia bacterium]|nr:zinc ribbon domain-containing protein [Acidimicrobiia bacterium]
MDEAPLVAEGTESTVEIVGRKVVLRQRGVKTMLKRGFALYRDPKSLVRAFDGPSKKVITAALAENKELARVIAGAVKGSGSAAAEEAATPAQAIAEAFKHNRQAVMDAIRANDTLVKDWLRDHKDLAGIVLKGDVHLFMEEVGSVALATGKDGRRVFLLMAEGQQHVVPFEAEHEDDFRRLCAALSDTVGPLTELPLQRSAPPSQPGSSGPASTAETKTCPMCAEDVKAAAVLCRFCGHRFDQQ